MSFYSYKNANPNCCPGTISGSALDGLQEKVCVQVKRVYDSAMTQEQLTKQTVTITSYAQVNNTCTCNACGCQETQETIPPTHPCRRLPSRAAAAPRPRATSAT